MKNDQKHQNNTVENKKVYENFISRFLVVSATLENSDEFWETPLGISLRIFNLQNKCSIAFKNKKGLPEVYNRFITEEYRDKYIVFIHDDVLIEDAFFLHKLYKGFETYSIIGLAGTTSIDLNYHLAAWHLMSKREHYRGEVAHTNGQKTWTTVFGPTDEPVLVLDGLFIAVKVCDLLDKGARFDERFEFHHYDISSCLDFHRKKLKMGVIPIRVTHYGLGDSMQTIDWEKSNKKFLEIWKNESI